LQKHFPCPGAQPSGLGALPQVANSKETIMGRGILLWLLGVPIPIIILLALIWH
jgi:hypothetical protein